MALTAEAARLTEAHRLAQAQLGQALIRQLVTAWQLVDPRAIDTTTARWLRVAVPLVQRQRALSARLGANYMTTFRTLEVGTGPFAPVMDTAADVNALATSLVVTGPVQLKSATGRGVALREAVRLSALTSARAGMRHALDGGRNTIIGSVKADRQALGWARATSGRPCAFCAMLASRGPVYSEDTVSFQAHDHCSCSAEPVYSRDADWPAGGRKYQEMWNEAKAAASRDSDLDAVTAFRRAIEGR